jgi:hypothetical protein
MPLSYTHLRPSYVPPAPVPDLPAPEPIVFVIAVPDLPKKSGPVPDVLPERVLLEPIADVLRDHPGIGVRDVLGKGRGYPVVIPRHRAMARLSKHYTRAAIARAMRVDPTTIRDALRKMA